MSTSYILPIGEANDTGQREAWNGGIPMLSVLSALNKHADTPINCLVAQKNEIYIARTKTIFFPAIRCKSITGVDTMLEIAFGLNGGTGDLFPATLVALAAAGDWYSWALLGLLKELSAGDKVNCQVATATDATSLTIQPMLIGMAIPS